MGASPRRGALAARAQHDARPALLPQLRPGTVFRSLSILNIKRSFLVRWLIPQLPLTYLLSQLAQCLRTTLRQTDWVPSHRSGAARCAPRTPSPRSDPRSTRRAPSASSDRSPTHSEMITLLIWRRWFQTPMAIISYVCVVRPKGFFQWYAVCSMWIVSTNFIWNHFIEN